MKRPYREPAEPDAIHIEPRPRDWWMLVWVVAGSGLGFCLVWAGYKDCTSPTPPPPPCSSYADMRSQDVPARCTKTYDPDAR